LTADDGKKVRLSDLKGSPVVLCFYPKDDTPGCTKKGCAFRDRHAEMEQLGAKVLGVSPDTVESHVKFRNKFNLNFPLLADPDHAVAEKYGAWRETVKRTTWQPDPPLEGSGDQGDDGSRSNRWGEGGANLHQQPPNRRWHRRPVGVESLEEAAMMLTEEQLQAVQKGEPVPVTVGHTAWVLIRKDRFRATRPLTYDASDWTEEE
jgi:hypothetical protein